MTTSAQQANALSVGELFSGADRYVIPLYQRNYTWGEEQIHQLVADIRTAYREDPHSTYHLGNLVVSPRKDNLFEVIDGQQRLTTLFLLLAHLDRAPGGPDQPAPPGYEARPVATETLRLLPKVVEDVVDPEGVDLVIAAASALIHTLVSGDDDAAEDFTAEFVKYVKSSVKLVRMTIPRSTDLNRYFEVMNTRGVQLSPVDIVKARLMKQLDSEDRRVFDIVWRGCSDMSRYVQMSVAPRDTALRERAFGPNWTVRPEDFTDLKARLGTTTAMESTAGAEPMRLQEAVGAYLTDSRGLDVEQDEEADRFSSQVGFEVFLLHVLAAMGPGEEGERQLDDRKLIARFTAVIDRISAEHPSSLDGWVKNFAVALLRYRMIFDSYVIKRDSTLHPGSDAESDDTVGDWSLHTLESDGRSTPKPRYRHTFPDDAAQKKIVLLQSALRITYTSPRGMHWITDVLRFVASTPDVRAEEFLAFIQEWTRSRVRAAMNAGPDGSFPSGFGTPRILFTYLDYLLVKDSRRDYRFGYRNSVEHFLPQTWDREKSADQFHLTDQSLLNDFGNLALVSVSANSKFSNNTPLEKAQLHGAKAQSPKLALMCQKLEDAGRQWKDAEVKSHREEMLDLLLADVAGIDAR
ncbi:DUF262 domain-containing protein [Dietzia natronolimnaea]|uniref:DUF262 domain-containing protein n=1 Tax=Dietzia natronolimnaea TaxID=161920 RepID=UPI0015F80E48|nr:DUF262 domain-containing protein [Dietzia natronolimnaea]MBB1036423.1 DUF262 domain-containing protein [Dietzia natronolimnaea]